MPLIDVKMNENSDVKIFKRGGGGATFIPDSRVRCQVTSVQWFILGHCQNLLFIV